MRDTAIEELFLRNVVYNRLEYFDCGMLPICQVLFTRFSSKWNGG